MLVNCFKKFTYETRVSSREFCIQLVENGEKLGDGITIKEKITDASWFFQSWINDPTIKAMLVMLNSIDEKLKNRSDEEINCLWNKLTVEISPIIFHFKVLNKIGLTDDLYIKMNARGKQLTDFENFKARFEKHIDESKFEVNLSPSEIFSSKIDTVLTDLFWKHRGDNNLIDKEFMKFIAGIAINAYAVYQEIYESKEEDDITRKILEEKKEKNITDDTVKRERIKSRITLLFNNPNEIKPEDFSSKTSFEYLKKCFDIYSNKELKYDELNPEELKLWEHYNGSIFKEFIKLDKPTYKQKVLFFAQTQFLLYNAYDEKQFLRWMRFVRNIVEHSQINSTESFIRFISKITELKSASIDIYKYLDKVKNEINFGFAEDQIKEEREKAKKILEDETWEIKIIRAENTAFFKGAIRFLFRENLSEYNWNLFDDRLAKCEKYFDKEGPKDEYNSILMRCLISKFSKWEHFFDWHNNKFIFYYDNTAINWKAILLYKNFTEVINQFFKEAEPKNIDFDVFSSNIEDHLDLDINSSLKLLQNDLCKTNIINQFPKKSFCQIYNKQFLISPFNAKSQSKKFVLGNKRNKVLHELIEEGLISVGKWRTIGKLPYLKGRIISFTLKDNNQISYEWDNELIKIENKKRESIPEVKLEDLKEYLTNETKAK